jgi:hypothetical protein
LRVRRYPLWVGGTPAHANCAPLRTDAIIIHVDFLFMPFPGFPTRLPCRAANHPLDKRGESMIKINRRNGGLSAKVSTSRFVKF